MYAFVTCTACVLLCAESGASLLSFEQHERSLVTPRGGQNSSDNGDDDDVNKSQNNSIVLRATPVNDDDVTAAPATASQSAPLSYGDVSERQYGKYSVHVHVTLVIAIHVDAFSDFYMYTQILTFSFAIVYQIC